MSRFTRAFFKVLLPGRRRFTFRWMTLLTVVLILGRAKAASEGVTTVGYYLLVLAIIEASRWCLSKWLFPGMERQVIIAPLGGPASVPPAPSFRGLLAALGPPLVIGGAAAGLLFAAPLRQGVEFLSLLVALCAVRLLPFYPMDGHIILGTVVRKTSIYWRKPAWREYVSAVGGGLIAVTGALFDPLGTGIILLPGGISVILENLYMLRLRRRSGTARPTGFPSGTRANPGDRARLDAILEKISREGMTGLTPEEEAFLREMSGRFRQKP